MKQEITTSGGTYVVTFTQAGTVEADRNNRTYILATASEAGQVAFKAISDSVIISDDNAILTAEDFVFAPGPILKPTSGGGGTLGAYVTWGGENNSEVTLNVPDGVDIPLSFRDKNVTKVSGTGGGITDCSSMFTSCVNLASLTLDLPSATNCNSMCYSCSNLASLTLDLPSATNCRRLCSYCNKIKSLTLDLPSATDCKSMCSDCSNLTTLICNFGSMSTLDFTSTTGNGGLGNVTTLQNVTILDGGLASCTAFNISASTALTDASIQNIIDALPDYSGTETSALVSFPPNRLTAEQQAQLAAKNWTWS